MRRTFFRQIGLKTNQVKNAIIVGGGTISVYLSLALLDMKIDVKVIEKDGHGAKNSANRFRRLRLSAATVQTVSS